MKTVPLNPNMPDTSHGIERSEEAAICGEIARHILDLAECTSQSRAISFVKKLSALHQADKDAFWFVLRILTGDMSELTKSFSELGKAHATSKQDQQQKNERAMAAIHLHFPHIERALVEMRGITAGYLPQTETRGDRMSYQ